LGLFFVLKEHQGVPSSLPVTLVDDHVLLRNAVVGEEFADLAHVGAERKAAHLQASVLVTFIDEVTQTHIGRLGTGLVALVGRSAAVGGGLSIIVVLSVLLGRTVVSAAASALVASTIAATFDAIFTVVATTRVALALVASFVVVAAIVAATASAAASATTTASAFEVSSVPSTGSAEAMLEPSQLILVEGNVLFSDDLEKFNEAASNVLLVAIVVGHFGVLAGLKENASFSSEFAIIHFTDLD